MLIGIDLDDTLIDFMPSLLHYHNIRCDTNLSIEQVNSFNLWEVWGGTKEEAVREVLDFYKTPLFRDIKPVPGSQKGIEVLAEKNELVVISLRPCNTYEETRWSVDKYFPSKFLRVYLTNKFVEPKGKSKSDICLDLGVDAMIEDCLDDAIECASRGIRVLLLDCSWNKSDEEFPGITRVKSWQEILKKI